MEVGSWIGRQARSTSGGAWEEVKEGRAVWTGQGRRHHGLLSVSVVLSPGWLCSQGAFGKVQGPLELVPLRREGPLAPGE